MMGRTHAASAAVAALGVAVVVGVPGPAVVVMAGAAWLSGWLPDVDHPASHAGRLLPPVRWAVRAVSVRTVGVAHRGLSHTVAAALVWGMFVTGLSALWLPPAAAAWTGVFAATGYLSGVLGDLVTIRSLDHLLWPARVQAGWPKLLRFRTGRTAERFVFRGLVAAGVFLLPMVAW